MELDQARKDAAAGSFLARLQSSVLVCDGAMGTMLYAGGISLDCLPPEVNLSRPQMVASVHAAYASAGVDILQTNTFGASRHRLARRGLEDQVASINAEGVRLAREARGRSGSHALIAGSVGPATQPGFRGRLSPAEVREALAEQVDALVAAGVDLLVFETFSDLREMVGAVEAASSSGAPIMAQMTFMDDGRTIAGDTPESVARTLEGLGVAVVGANCTLGPQGVLEVVQQLRRHTDLPLSAQPNAGLPALGHGHLRYAQFSDYFARYARRFVDQGTVVVGGCCGTTPQHIQAVVRAVRGLRAPPRRAARPTVTFSTPGPEEVAPGRATRLAEKLAARSFVVASEMQPALGADPERALRDATALKEMGVDAVVVGPAVSPRAQISPVTLALLLQQRLQMETVLTAATWDRSAMALQADLLGAHTLGIRNVICRTGTPPPRGDYPQVGGMWDVDSVDLIRILHGLNSGQDANGIPIGRPTSFFVGARINPTADDFDAEVESARRKLAAGADFLVTTPVYDIDALFSMLDALQPQVPIFLGITPLENFEQAEYLRHEVPETSVPDAIMDRMCDAGDRAWEVGIEIARETMERARPRIGGVLISSTSASVAHVEALSRGLAG